ncbi:hypothetical protein ABER99_06110 [Paenibacillus glucanolyticus]|nr:hypothetical protein [Paenibacillus glucanolyticus]
MKLLVWWFLRYINGRELAPAYWMPYVQAFGIEAISQPFYSPWVTLGMKVLSTFTNASDTNKPVTSLIILPKGIHE